MQLHIVNQTTMQTRLKQYQRLQSKADSEMTPDVPFHFHSSPPHLHVMPVTISTRDFSKT